MWRGKRGIVLRLALSLALLSSMAGIPGSAFSAAILYKSYIVRKDGNQDILCAPYIVQPNDYVLKIFKEHGELSQDNFPEFLQIFKRINPQIDDINRIRPGQSIFLPLKKLAPNSLPGQATGVVTIPYVTLSTIPALLKGNAHRYVLKRGDTVSGILSGGFGKYGTPAYRRAMRVFQLLNPHITNLNRVFAGQPVWLPTAALRNQPWYASLFDAAGRIIALKPASPASPPPPPPPPPPQRHRETPLQTVARLLCARIYDRGTYYFPRSGMADAELNLAEHPLLKFPDHRRTLFLAPGTEKQDLSAEDLSVIRSFWPSLSILPVSADAPAAQILDAYAKAQPGQLSGPNTVRFLDRGVRVSVKARWWLHSSVAAAPPEDAVQTKPRIGVIPTFGPNSIIPKAIDDLLSRHGILLKTLDGTTPQWRNCLSATAALQKIPAGNPADFVAALAAATGLSYSTGVAISFPYYGMQIPAVTNLITSLKGRSILVDFGSFYGGAITAIENSGLQVLSIRGGEPRRRITEQILTAAELSYQTDPIFSIPSAQAAYGVRFSVPGFLLTQTASRKRLLSLAPLPPALVQWFAFKGLRVVQIAAQRTHS